MVEVSSVASQLMPMGESCGQARFAREGTQIATTGYSIQIKAHTIRVTQVEKAESEGCDIRAVREFRQTPAAALPRNQCPVAKASLGLDGETAASQIQ